MCSTKGWEEGWLFFCICHDTLIQFLEDGPKEENDIIVKRNEELWLWMKCKQELYYFAKLTTSVMEYILKENHTDIFFFILTSHQITYYFLQTALI